MNFILSSIRMKMTLAMLFVGLFSIITVGVISRSIMLNRFDNLVVQEASRGFIDETLDYYRAYGSWERARNSESFFTFVRRTRPDMFTPGPPQTDQPPPDRPPREDGPEGARRFSFGGEPPPFIVTNDNGQVELALFGDYKIGDLVPQNQLDRAIPIMDGANQIGLAVPEQRFEISALEARYLSVFESSWFISLVLASLVALVLGWYFGRRMTHPILQLKWSMDAMRQGELKHQLEVRSRDELGKLTEIFNKMSKDLHQTYQELEASNRLLSEYSNWLASENTRLGKKKK